MQNVALTRYGRSRREHLTDYLIKAETKASRIDEQDNYAFCRRLVNLAFEEWPDPWVAAFYYHYGKHPKKLIPIWLSRDAKDKCMEIADYDSTSELRIPPPHIATVYQMPAPRWSTEQDSLRDPQEEERDGQPRVSRTGAAYFAGLDALLVGPPPDSRNKIAHSPIRLIVDRSEVRGEDGRITHYSERLQCGHSHIEFPGGNPGKRRRCRSCITLGPADGGSISTAFLRSCSGLGGGPGVSPLDVWPGPSPVGPAKLCECGCGGDAPIAPQTNRSKNWVKGQQLRFIKNHHKRRPTYANLRRGTAPLQAKPDVI